MKTSLVARVAAGSVALSMLASATPALAHTSTTTATSTVSTYNVACVQAAVGAHEDAGTSALNTFNAAVSAALVVRKADIVAAWGNLNFSTRIHALKSAYTKYQASVKVARTNFTSSRKTSNTTFKSAMTACGTTHHDIDGHNKIEKTILKENDMKGWNWFGFHLGLDLDK